MNVVAWLGGKRPQDLGLQVLRESQRPILPGTVDRTMAVPGRPGEYDFGADSGPRAFELECAFMERNAVKLQERIEHLAQLLMDEYGRPKPIQIIFSTRPDRYYTVRYAGALPIERIAGYGRFRLPLVAYYPFARLIEDASDIDVDSNIGVDNSLLVDSVYSFSVTSPSSVEVDNFGSLNVGPTVVITGSFTSFSLAIGGKVFSYNAPLTSGTLTVDMKRMTARIGTTNVLGNTSGDFPVLAPGRNTVSIGGSGLQCTINFVFNPEFI